MLMITLTDWMARAREIAMDTWGHPTLLDDYPAAAHKAYASGLTPRGHVNELGQRLDLKPYEDMWEGW